MFFARKTNPNTLYQEHLAKQRHNSPAKLSRTGAIVAIIYLRLLYYEHKVRLTVLLFLKRVGLVLN